MLFRTILAFSLFLSFSAAFAADGFTVYVTTQAANRYGGNIMLDIGKMNLSELPNLFSPFTVSSGESVLPKSSDPVEVIIVVPKGAPQNIREHFKRSIAAEVGKRYPNLKLKIQESFVDLDADTKVLLEQREDLRALEAQLPDGTHEDDLVKQASLSIEAGLQDNETFRRSWFTRQIGKINSTHPYNTVIAARAVALTKFFASGAVIVSKYGLNPVSALIGGLSGSIAAIFGYNAKKWSEFCTAHQFPWLKDFLPIRKYNETGWFKSATVNLIRSLGVSYILRLLAYGTGQTIKGKPVDTPNSLEFLAGGLGLTIPEIILDGLLDDGARSLELKGVFNHQSRSYILWLIGLLDTVMHASFRAGAVEMAYGVALVSWGAKLAVWGGSKLAATGTARFVFVSDLVQDKKLAELHENRSNFFNYLRSLVTGLIESIAYRRRGEFSVGDETMVVQHFGLEETWKTSFSDENHQRLENDPQLTEKAFSEILHLKDADRSIVKALWKIRNDNLGKSINWTNACAQALVDSGILAFAPATVAKP